ncbi:MAG: hypothetical protein ACR2M1_07810 [Gemmatimonadaceae bacterium]
MSDTTGNATGNNDADASPNRLPEPDRNNGNSAPYLPGPAVKAVSHAPQPDKSRLNGQLNTQPTDRRGRIALFTADRNATKLPDDFGTSDGDWQTVRDDDPFTRLYLDPDQPELITAERTQQQFELLNAFWDEKMQLLNRGAGRESLVRKYGGPEHSESAMRGYTRRLQQAWDTLKDTGRIQAALRKRDDERRDRALVVIRQSMDDMIADHAFVVAESSRLFARGAGAGLRDEEIADFVAATLRQESFVPAGNPQGETLAERLQSCDWYRTGHAPPTRAGVLPFKIGSHRAHSVRELIDACDAEPDVAQDYLFAGDIAGWLGGPLEEGGLARSTRELVKQNTPGRNALELFVRSLSRDQGLPAEPDFELPATLNFGLVPIGSVRKLQLGLRSTNSRRGWGTCTLIPALPGLSVTRSFSITDGAIELDLTTFDAQPGTYGTDLLIQIEGGRSRTIPVRFHVAKATLRVVPDSIDLGTLDFGRTYETVLVVDTVEGDATLKVAYSSDRPGDALTITGDEIGKQCTANVRLATSKLRAGTSGQGLVHIATNVGAVDVPVRYSITLNRTHAIRWAAGAAVIGAIALGLVRWIMAGSNTELTGWISGLTMSGPVFVTGFELGLCILLVSFVASGIAKRKRKKK